MLGIVRRWIWPTLLLVRSTFGGKVDVGNGMLQELPIGRQTMLT